MKLLSVFQMAVDNLCHRPAHQEGGQLGHRPALQPLDHRPAHQTEPETQGEAEEEQEEEQMTTFEKFNSELNSTR